MKTKSLVYFQTIIILILLALLFKSCGEKNTTIQKSNFQTSSHMVERDAAIKMQELYKATQYKIINEKLGYQDYREYVYPLKALKDYISYLEQKADELNYDESTLGIRIYNAAKNENGRVRSSIFMIGTYKEAKTSAAASFNLFSTNEMYNAIDENFKGDTKAFNYGTAGMPPKEFN